MHECSKHHTPRKPRYTKKRIECKNTENNTNVVQEWTNRKKNEAMMELGYDSKNTRDAKKERLQQKDTHEHDEFLMLCYGKTWEERVDIILKCYRNRTCSKKICDTKKREYLRQEMLRTLCGTCHTLGHKRNKYICGKCCGKHYEEKVRYAKCCEVEVEFPAEPEGVR